MAAPSDHPPLLIRLLGPFEVRVHGQPLRPLRTRKGEWLLALLTLQHERPLPRSWLAGTLWPASDSRQGAESLRRCLTDLRQALGPEAGRLRSPTAHTLSLHLAGAEVDLLAFDRAVASGDGADLAEAVRLYQGPLLAGCDEEWVLGERRAREEGFLCALERLAEGALGRNEPAVAVGYLRRAVTADPLRETAQRALMRVMAESGERAAALTVYREFRLLLHREANVAPDPETQALFEQIRAEMRRQAPSREEGLPSGRRPAPPGAIPRTLTRLIGREQEVREIKALLESGRLVTVTGAGGVGKTRLAVQVAEELHEGYRDGACLVDLAPLADAKLVAQAVAAALGVEEQPHRAPEQVLAGFLREKELLLVLDNCEHLIEATAALVHALLDTCPALSVLATSRQRLGLTGECVWRAPSLALPPSVDGQWLMVDGPRGIGEDGRRDTVNHPLSTISQYAAVQLFVERAAMARAGFRLAGREEALAVARICRRLDGIPLAIELAAARVTVLSLSQIAARLDDMFALLTGGSRAALPRHRTLRATMEWSYRLLGESEQAVLRRLSVFAGGWTLEAAEAVCHGDGIRCSVFGGNRARTEYRTPKTEYRYWRAWRGWWTTRWRSMRRMDRKGGTGCWRRCGSMGGTSCRPVARRRRSGAGTWGSSQG